MYNAPDFDEENAINMLVDGTTMFVAKAATQSGAILDVQFDWESDAPFNVSVDDGMLTANRKGQAKITATAAERGIAVSFIVTVHKAVKSIVVTPDGSGPYEVGETEMLTAVAYDGEDGAGDKVEGVSFMWASSDASVAVEDTDGATNTVTMKSAGSAKVTASIGDVKSNEVSFSVFSVVTPERRIVVRYFQRAFLSLFSCQG